MLAGDDEIDALLAEMGGGSPASSTKPNKIKQETTALPQVPLQEDPRMKNPISQEWYQHLRLKESFEDNKCSGWKSSATDSDTCEKCDSSRAFHRLSISKKIQKKYSYNTLVLPWLFCYTRNIRCMASENNIENNTNDYCQRKNMDQIEAILQDPKTSKWLSSADYIAIQEKARDLKSILLQDNDNHNNNNNSLQIILKADLLYYRIYYAFLTLSSAATELAIPDPPMYFSSPGMAWKVTKQFAKNLVEELDSSTRRLLVDTMGLFFYNDNNTPTFSNPRHTLWQHRFYEMAKHYYWPQSKSTITLQSLNQATIRPGNMHAQFAQHETLAPPHLHLLADWRDAARDFPASLYAYATPSPYALQQLTSLLQQHNYHHVVEMGAGTGYWAALLQQHGVQVTPYDLSPPGEYSENEYHSEVPAFTKIQQCDAATSSVHRTSTSTSTSKATQNTALLLCYPPPGTDMALKAVQGFAGYMVLHVGEWAGLTGDSAFESYLLQRFECQTYIPLPIWGTDAAYVTVWKRTNRAATSSAYVNVATGGCSSCQEKTAAVRCRFARMLQYCSRTCFDSHQTVRHSVLKVHMIQLGDADLEWSSKQHFLDLGTISGKKHHSNERVLQSGKRKKKRRRKK